MKQFIILLGMSLYFIAPSMAQTNVSIVSPNKQIELIISDESRVATYKVLFNNQKVIFPSKLGLVTEDEDFSIGLKIIDKGSIRKIAESRTVHFGKKSTIGFNGRERVVTFQNASGQLLKLICRVNDEGVAFAYELDGEGETTVIEEHTTYSLGTNTTGFLTPMAKSHTGFGETNPSYEDHYACNITHGTPSAYGQGWLFPALFRNDNGTWLLLSETGVDGNYVASHIAEKTDEGLCSLEFAHEDNFPIGESSSPVVKLPFVSPWRTINVAANLNGIVASTMAQDLVQPKYTSEFEYKPGRAAWSWLVLKDANTNIKVQKEFVDMAAMYGFEYLLVDALWDTQIGKAKIKELADYAASKNVSLILWYNSNGNWNQAPQTPIQVLNNPESRRAEMEWMKSIGVKGMKIDFFSGDKQFMMKYYEDLLKDANEYGLYVNFHGTTLPRGWDAMYPNYATSEAVKGMEYCTFGQADADEQPHHCTILPFTRNVVGPMDFTPLVLNPTLGVEPDSGTIRRTTAAFELALPVIFCSSIQHFGLIPNIQHYFQTDIVEYLKKVPTAWDETMLIAGYPGKYVVMARHVGNKWYIAGINGTNQPMEINFNMPYGEGERAMVIEDFANNKNTLEIKKIIMQKDERMNYKLQPYGGFVIYPAK